MKTAIVTGAGRGIGRAIALKLSGLGYNLVATGRTEAQLEDLRKEIENGKGQCLPLAVDLQDADAPAMIIEKTMTRFGQLDVLVNNAGMSHSGPVSETDEETWDWIHRVNARAPFFLCKEAVPHLAKSPGPVIINVGSVVGFKGYAEQAAYASSKHALTGFTKVLAKEVQPLGIRVHLISPGGVNTDMVSEMRPDINTEELIQTEEIAELVEFLVSRKGKGTIDHLYIRRFSGLAFD
jgi:3-oxoacyl-[acyl-carrier protein] reductase